MSELLRHELDPEYIGRLERGVITWPNAEYRTAFRRYFGVVSGADLGFYSKRSGPAPPWEDDEMRRRAVLGALPLVGISAAEPLTTLVDKLAAELAPIPRRVGSAEVEQIYAASAHAYDLEVRFGGAAVYEMLSAQLRWAVRLLDAHIDRWASSGLYAAVGNLARQVAWAAHDIGLDSAAQHCCHVALRCAEEVDDWSLRTKAFHDLSRFAERSGDGDTALTMAQQGMVRTDRLTSLECATISAAEAAAHGRRGDLQPCLTSLSHTEDHIATANPQEETPALVAYFSPAEVDFTASTALWPLTLRGHAVDDSIQRLRAAADTYPAHRVRARSRCQARLATLLFWYDDPDEAATVANTALDDAHTVRSRWVTEDLRVLRNATRHHRDHPGVAELRHQLNRTLGQSSALP